MKFTVFKPLLASAKGAALIEYVVLMGGVAVMGIFAISSLGGKITETFETSTVEVQNRVVPDSGGGGGGSGPAPVGPVTPVSGPGTWTIPANLPPAYIPAGANPGESVACALSSQSPSSAAPCVWVDDPSWDGGAYTGVVIIDLPSIDTGYWLADNPLERTVVSGFCDEFAFAGWFTIELVGGASVYLDCLVRANTYANWSGYDGLPGLHFFNVPVSTFADRTTALQLIDANRDIPYLSVVLGADYPQDHFPTNIVLMDGTFNVGDDWANDSGGSMGFMNLYCQLHDQDAVDLGWC